MTNPSRFQIITGYLDTDLAHDYAVGMDSRTRSEYVDRMDDGECPMALAAEIQDEAHEVDYDEHHPTSNIGAHQ